MQKIILPTQKVLIKHLRKTSIKNSTKILYLNTKKELVKECTFGNFHQNTFSITIKDILKPALIQKNCSGIVVAHYHLNNSYPTQTDFFTTHSILDACEVLHLKLYDHIILTEKRHFSFRESGVL